MYMYVRTYNFPCHTLYLYLPYVCPSVSFNIGKCENGDGDGDLEGLKSLENKKSEIGLDWISLV